jgi:hypothetical protein
MRSAWPVKAATETVPAHEVAVLRSVQGSAPRARGMAAWNPRYTIMPAMGCRATPTDFTGWFSINSPQGTNFNAAGILPARSLATPGTGEPARQAASSGLLGCWPGWAVPAPATTEPATYRNTGARCYRMQRGENKKRPDLLPRPPLFNLLLRFKIINI